jgi:hypothetical protein
MTHEIQFPKYAAYYAFAEDTCKKNLKSRMPHGDKGVAVPFSTRSRKPLAREIFKRAHLAEKRSGSRRSMRSRKKLAGTI